MENVLGLKLGVNAGPGDPSQLYEQVLNVWFGPYCAPYKQECELAAGQTLKFVNGFALVTPKSRERENRDFFLAAGVKTDSQPEPEIRAIWVYSFCDAHHVGVRQLTQQEIDLIPDDAQVRVALRAIGSGSVDVYEYGEEISLSDLRELNLAGAQSVEKWDK